MTRPFDPQAYEPIDDPSENVGMTEYDDTFAGFEPITVEPEQLERFAKRAQDLGWEQVVMHVRFNRPVFGHESNDDFGMYLTLAPYIDSD